MHHPLLIMGDGDGFAPAFHGILPPLSRSSRGRPLPRPPPGRLHLPLRRSGSSFFPVSRSGQGGRHRPRRSESSVPGEALLLIRILHLADLHLGYLPPWKEAAESRRRERDMRLSAAVDWALAHGVDLVLIAGDLFETHRPPASRSEERRVGNESSTRAVGYR